MSDTPNTLLADQFGPWWEYSKVPAFGSGEIDARWSGLALDLIALKGGPVHLFKKYEGNITITLEELDAKLAEWGFKCVSKCSYPSLTQMVYFTKNSLVELEFTMAGGKFICGIDTNDKALFEEFGTWVKAHLTHKSTAGQVHVLVASDGGLHFEVLGLAGHALERGNYSKEVLKGFDKVIADLNSPTPSGRLAIFNGPPGGGKTFQIKALLDQLEGAVFCIVPQHMAVELASPSIIPSLINLKQSAKGTDVPIIFIIEDADNCLISREANGNASIIAAVLNLCDGIVGELLDIRIIATTNAESLLLDKALTRPGRCSAHIEVKALSHEDALSVIKRLSGPEATLPEQKEYTLAELYKLHHEGTTQTLGIEPKRVKKLGF